MGPSLTRGGTERYGRLGTIRRERRFAMTDPMERGSGEAARILLVTDVRLYREGIEAVLADREGVEVVASASACGEALELAGRLRPEIALVDVAMPDAVEGVRAIRRAAPGVKILALTVPETEGEVLTCIEAGVSGYVTRESSVDDLVAAIQSAGRDEMLCSPRIAATLVRRVAALAADAGRTQSEALLTSRELEIVGLIDEGLSNKEIASRLLIEVPTVKNHVHNILEKLHVRRRADAAAAFRRRGGRVHLLTMD
jgi:two-component system nitrate/nitrite response regulator NarL